LGVAIAALTPESRALAEQLARQPDVDAADGRTIVEILLTDGRATKLITHRHLAAGQRDLEPPVARSG
jgi:phospholipid N-methyltransferase